MYDIKFATVSGGGWGEIIEAINDDTNGPLTDIDTGTIELQVQDRNGGIVLSASTSDGTITRPASGKFQWNFTVDQVDALCVGETYPLGCRYFALGDTDHPTPLFSGSLAYGDGGFEWR